LVNLEIALFGVDNKVELLKARLRLVSLLLLMRDTAQAAVIMREAYASQCRGPWSTLSKEDFLVLCDRYCAVGEMQALVIALVNTAAKQ
jgi:hypothetical protein